MSPVDRASPVVCEMRFSARLTEATKTGRRLYKLKYGARELISIVPLIVALLIRVTLLLQLNGILLKWEIQQISQNTATEAASDRSVMRS